VGEFHRSWPTAVFPLIEEIAASLGQHDMIIGTGSGSRAHMPIASGSIWATHRRADVLATCEYAKRPHVELPLAKYSVPLSTRLVAQLPHYWLSAAP
jgi:hypothetical protein